MVPLPETPKNLLKEILRMYSFCSAIGSFSWGTSLAVYRINSVRPASAVTCSVGGITSVRCAEHQRGEV